MVRTRKSEVGPEAFERLRQRRNNPDDEIFGETTTLGDAVEPAPERESDKESKASTPPPTATETAQALAGTFNVIAKVFRSEARFKASEFTDMANNIKNLGKRFPLLGKIVEALLPLTIIGEGFDKFSQVMENRKEKEPEQPQGFFTTRQDDSA